VSHVAVPIWSVVREPNAALARDANDVPVVARSEWVRIFLGRAVSFANVVDDGRGAEYLVLGTDAVAGGSERAGLARAALEADFAYLKKLVAQHRALLDQHRKTAAAGSSVADAEIMTRAYATLRRVTVPEDPRDWRCTDEGLSIVRWGLEGRGRPLLSWTEEELDRQRKQVLEHHPALRDHAGRDHGHKDSPDRSVDPKAVVEAIAGQSRKPAPPAPAPVSVAAPQRAPAPRPAATPAAAPRRAAVAAPAAPAVPAAPVASPARPPSFGASLLRSPAAWGVIASVFAVGALLGVILAKVFR